LSEAAIQTTPDEEEFWVWSAMAEAYYGLGDIENYTNARNEAMLITGAGWMMDTLVSGITRLDNVLKSQTQLFARVKKSLALEPPPPSGNMPFTDSPQQGKGGGEHRGGLKKDLPSRNQIFISYSHNDKKWLKKLQTMLKPMIRNDTVTVWDDTLIKPGTKWREEINKILSSARLAVLLVSPDFLASDFIANHELPPLLKASAKEGLSILWIAVSYSLYEETPISEYQAAHDSSRPLDSLSPSEQNRVLSIICLKIKEAINQ
jgi:hypothetical protein